MLHLGKCWTAKDFSIKLRRRSRRLALTYMFPHIVAFYLRRYFAKEVFCRAKRFDESSTAYKGARRHWPSHFAYRNGSFCAYISSEKLLESFTTDGSVSDIFLPPQYYFFLLFPLLKFFLPLHSKPSVKRRHWLSSVSVSFPIPLDSQETFRRSLRVPWNISREKFFVSLYIKPYSKNMNRNAALKANIKEDFLKNIRTRLTWTLFWNL